MTCIGAHFRRWAASRFTLGRSSRRRSSGYHEHAGVHPLGRATGEALALAQASGIELGTAFRAIGHSLGNSFVFASEGQVILNGSYQIDFTLDLVLKDLALKDLGAEGPWR